MHNSVGDDHTPAGDVAAAHEALREGGPTVFVGLLICSGKEYVWGATLRALLDQTYPLPRVHFDCIFDGEARIPKLWWDRFCKAAADLGATTSSETVELEERHRARWVNVGTLRERARQRFLATECSHLWWVECDCPPPAHALMSLVGVNQPMVTAAVACRGNARWLNHLTAHGQPTEPSHLDGLDLREDEPPALLVGCLGCCLMERRGLEHCGWEPDWQQEEFIGGEDGYIQGLVKEALGCELLLDPHVLVPHCDVVPRDPDGVMGHIPVRSDSGAVAIQRREWKISETPGMWRPRPRPWTVVRPWRNLVRGQLVPEELRELIADRYRWAYTCEGPELPPLELAQHELLLPGEQVRITGKYAEVNEHGDEIGVEAELQRGETVRPGLTPAGFDLVEIEVIDECHIWA